MSAKLTFKDAHARAFPDLAHLSRRMRDVAQAGRPLRTWGNRTYYPEPERAYVFLNTLIQGSAADMTKEAMIRAHRAGLELVLTAHDQLTIVSDAGDAVRNMALLRDAMEGVEFSVPLRTDASWSPRGWGSLEPWPPADSIVPIPAKPAPSAKELENSRPNEGLKRDLRKITTDKRYQVLYVDPPWKYSDLGHSRRVDRIYPLMSLEELMALRQMIDELADESSVLFLWITAPMLMHEGPRLLEAWNFTYKSSCIWDKEIFGMGHYWRIQHELLLLATRGKPGTSAVHNLPSIFRERRREHSRKPERAYEMIEQMYPAANRIELFARSRREGWDAWGNEIGNDLGVNGPMRSPDTSGEPMSNEEDVTSEY